MVSVTRIIGCFGFKNEDEYAIEKTRKSTSIFLVLVYNVAKRVFYHAADVGEHAQTINIRIIIKIR